MGRPLRAKYSGGVAIGVQEMSDDEIADIILPKLVNYAIANPDSVYGTKLRINGSGTYDVVRGTFYDYRTSSFAGEHPVTYNLINTYNFTQNERAITPSVSARPVHHVTVGDEQRILEMSDTDIYNYLLPTTISRLTYYGSGSYVITQTNAGPGSLGWSGTWVSIGTFVDTYWIASSLTSVSYTLWQRTDTISVGTTYRPLKQVLVSGEQRLVEMTDLEIESLYVFIGESIRTTGVGQYSFSTSAPAQGTWANLGSAIDRLNIAIDTNYTGYYSGTYVGSYTGLYSGSYQSTFVGQYGNTFTALYTGIYNLLTPFTGQYAGTYNRAFTGAFSGAYTGAFSGLYNSTFSAVYPGSYTGAYNQAFTGAFTGGYIIYFTGVYAGTYTGIFNRPSYLGWYTRVFQRTFGSRQENNYAGSYLGAYNNQNTAMYVGYYVGGYQRTFGSRQENFYSGSYAAVYQGIAKGFTGNYTGQYTTGTYTGAYSKAFTGTFTGVYSRIVNASFTSTYAGTYSRAFTGAYAQSFTGFFSGIYTGAYSSLVPYTGAYNRVYSGGFTGAYTSAYSGVYTGVYTRAWTGTYTGVYTGLTAQNTLQTATKSLFVRTA